MKLVCASSLTARPHYQGRSCHVEVTNYQSLIRMLTKIHFFFFLNQLTMVCEINDLSSDEYSPYFVPHLIILTENDRVTFSL